MVDVPFTLNELTTVYDPLFSTSEYHKPHNEKMSQGERHGATSDEEGRPGHKTSRKPSPERVQNKKRSLLAQNRDTGKCAK